MGMTTKSYSNRFTLLRNRSTYRSGSIDNWDQNVVSNNWILSVPQIFCLLQSPKQSLFYPDGDKQKGKELTEEQTSHANHLTMYRDLSISLYLKSKNLGNWEGRTWRHWQRELTWIYYERWERNRHHITYMGADLLFQRTIASAFLDKSSINMILPNEKKTYSKQLHCNADSIERRLLAKPS